MFTKQVEQMETLRGMTPEQGWDQLLDILRSTLGNCSQPLTHRGPVDISLSPDNLPPWTTNQPCDELPGAVKGTSDGYVDLNGPVPKVVGGAGLVSCGPTVLYGDVIIRGNLTIQDDFFGGGPGVIDPIPQYKPWAVFELTEDLEIDELSANGFLVTQWGNGIDWPGFEVVLINAENPGFTADSGTTGICLRMENAGPPTGSLYQIVHIHHQYKPYVIFEVADGVSLVGHSAEIISQWGPGRDNPNTSIDVKNPLKAFGPIGSREAPTKGIAGWDQGNDYLILNMQCGDEPPGI